MSDIEKLVKSYEKYVALPWDTNLAGPQKVWFAEYDPSQERRLRLRIEAFQTATIRASHEWHLVDITNAFAEWMANHEYRDAYFERPGDMRPALAEFADSVASKVEQALTQPDNDEDTLVAILGLGSLFGLVRAAELVATVVPHITGRMLVFFPGQHDGSIWRLLNARDGWNYHAVPISGSSSRE